MHILGVHLQTPLQHTVNAPITDPSSHPHGCCLRSADISKSRNVIQLTSIWVRLDCFSLRMFVQTLEIIAAPAFYGNNDCTALKSKAQAPNGCDYDAPKKWLSSPIEKNGGPSGRYAVCIFAAKSKLYTLSLTRDVCKLFLIHSNVIFIIKLTSLTTSSPSQS